jgi:hypothetical protein
MYGIAGILKERERERERELTVFMRDFAALEDQNEDISSSESA